MMNIQVFTFNPLQENTYVLFDESKEALIIDPGCYEKEENETLKGFITSNDLKVKYLLNTHCHVDHVLGNSFVKQQYNVPLLIHPIEKEVLKAVKIYAPFYGIHNYQETEADSFLEEGDKILFGNTILEILFVPGHSPGHIAFINMAQKICISGDVLFFRSIGRTDLPGGDFKTIINSISNKLFNLNDDFDVFPGHGPKTNMGDEKKLNPFLNTL